MDGLYEKRCNLAKFIKIILETIFSAPGSGGQVIGLCDYTTALNSGYIITFDNVQITDSFRVRMKALEGWVRVKFSGADEILGIRCNPDFGTLDVLFRDPTEPIGQRAFGVTNLAVTCY